MGGGETRLDVSHMFGDDGGGGVRRGEAGRDGRAEVDRYDSGGGPRG